MEVGQKRIPSIRIATIRGKKGARAIQRRHRRCLVAGSLLRKWQPGVVTTYATILAAYGCNGIAIRTFLSRNDTGGSVFSMLSPFFGAGAQMPNMGILTTSSIKDTYW